MARLRAFTLIELLIAVAIIAVLIGILLPAVGGVRKQAKLTICLANERTYATAMGSYAAEKKDRLAAMDWRSGDAYPSDLPGWGPLAGKYFPEDLVAASYQVVSIIRHKTNLGSDFAPVPENWIPFILYTHIPLNDYIGGVLPSPVAACTEDAWRIAVQRKWSNPRDAGLPYPENGGDGSSTNWRWPFSTSYNIHQAHWGPSRARYQYNARTTVPGYFLTAIWYPTDTGGGVYYSKEGVADEHMPGQFGYNKLTDVRFPSSKTIMSDEWGRHFGRRPLHFSAPESRQPLAFYDGSVRVFTTGETNPGWNPVNRSERSNMTSRLSYTKQQQSFDPPMNPVSKVLPDDGSGFERSQYRVCAGWFRYTRGGLFGWDVPRGFGAKGARAVIKGTGLGATMSAVEENELDTSKGGW